MDSEKIKILIVDDIKDNRVIVKSTLKSIENLKFYEAENGIDAVEITSEIKPDIIMMDIMMPKMDGFEATKIIKQEYPEIFVMVITAIEDYDVEKKMTEAGANCYTKKPIDGDILKFKIKNLINIKNSKKSIFEKKDVLNPFSNEIRNLKIFSSIENEDDIMDFGTWIVDFYHRYNTKVSIKFHKKLEFLYKIMNKTLQNGEILTIIIEDGFDLMYVNFGIPRNISINLIKDKYVNILEDDLIINERFVHLRIDPNKNKRKKENNEKKINDSRVINYENSKHESLNINEHDRVLLRQSHIDKVHAKDFVAQMEGVIIDEIHDLIDLEEHWGDYLDRYESKADTVILIEISNILSKYSSVINSLYSFMALSYGLSSLSVFLREIDTDSLDNSLNKNLINLLQGVKNDLMSWRVNIFEEQNTNDIHYLDSSLLSSCMQIESLLTHTDIKDDQENDLELF